MWNRKRCGPGNEFSNQCDMNVGLGAAACDPLLINEGRIPDCHIQPSITVYTWFGRRGNRERKSGEEIGHL